MRIALNSSIELPFLFKEIGFLTDRAIINPLDVKYQQDIKIINIPMKRQNLVEYRKDLFSTKPIYTNEEINSILIVKKIKECNIINQCNNIISEITLIFGVQIKSDEISLLSAEESMGNNFYTLTLKVDELDIEFYDLK